MTEQQPITAVINVAPQFDDSLIKLQVEGEKVLEIARSREITSNEDLTSFTEDLSLLASLRRAIEDKRKDYTQPINGYLKNVNDAFKVLSAPLEEANEILRKKMLDWRVAQEVKRQAAEDANNLRMEAARKEAEANGGEITESVKLITPVDAAPDKVHTGVGSSGVSQIWKWREKDFAAVPDGYKMLDAAKIGKLVRAGMRDIPGIEIYSEDSLRISTKREGK